MPTSILPIPSDVRYIGLGRETTRGTAVAPTVFIPLRTFSSPNEMPHYAQDKGMRGSAVDVYDEVATQTWSSPGFDGDVFPDSIGYLLHMLMGEVSTSGSTPTTSTTLNGGVAAGANTIVVTSATGLLAGDNIQIDTANLSEVKTILSIATNTITFAVGQGLTFAHLTGVAVTKVVAPFVHAFTVLNTTPFQPPSYTITDYRGSTNGEQRLPGALCSELTLRGTATGLLQFSGKFLAFRATNIAKTIPVYSTEPVKPAWQGATTLGGSSTLLLEDFELQLRRSVDAITSINGTQDPAAIFSGGDFSAGGRARLIYTGDDTEYAKMVANTSTALDINFTSGAGSALRAVKLHASTLKYDNIVPDNSKSWISLPIQYKAVANTTDIGNSGGYCPVKVTLSNAVPSYT